jgi:sugar/nucleoside kinase (ribokinase family)
MTIPTDVLCAGIVVADHVCNPIHHLPAAGELVLTDRFLLTIGGCAANVAVDLTRMGVRASVAGRVGGDVFGRVVGDMLREQGVDTSALQTSPGADTSQTMIVNVAGDDRRFIHSFGANALFTAADVPAERVARCRVLYLGGYLVLPAVQQDELVNVFAAARRTGAKTVLDVVVPGPGDHRKQLERLLPHVDVFLPNGHEAGVITGESDPLRQAEAFRRLGAATVVITMGGDGCVLVGEGIRLRSGVYPIEYVDGSGGGDAFDAGYIYGLLNGMSPEDCIRVASALGASCVRAIGTTTGVFTRPECESFLKKHTLRVERV